MTPAPRFIPERTLEGGTLVGTTYTSEAVGCWYAWYNGFFRPHPDSPTVEAGIQPRFKSPFLLAGGTVHVGMATWYSSGVLDGKDTGARDIERAVQAARSHHDRQLDLYADADRADEDWNMTELLLRSYHDRYGPHGPAPEWPELEVLCDGEGRPLVEREFSISLGYRDYVFTSRPDLIVSVRGLLRTRDHKTCTPAYNGKYIRERKEWTYWDPQFKGEALVLSTLFPNEPLQGAEANVLVKNRSPKSKFDVAERETFTWAETDLWAFKLELIDILQQIDDRVGRYRLLLTNGYDPEVAACQVFPRHGTRTQKCVAYGGCPYQSLCLSKDRIAEALRQFKPRAIEDTKAARGRAF